MSDEHRAPEGHDRAHEVTDVPLRPLVFIGAGMAVAAVLIFAAVAVLYAFIYSRETPSRPPAFADSGVLPPEPRLQLAPAEDLARFRAREDAALSTYAWIDRENGVVRIPIERAMELLVERRKQP